MGGGCGGSGAAKWVRVGRGGGVYKQLWFLDAVGGKGWESWFLGLGSLGGWKLGSWVGGSSCFYACRYVYFRFSQLYGTL